MPEMTQEELTAALETAIRRSRQPLPDPLETAKAALLAAADEQAESEGWRGYGSQGWQDTNPAGPVEPENDVRYGKKLLELMYEPPTWGDAGGPVAGEDD